VTSMLPNRSVPVELPVRRTKLQEVHATTWVCTLCFTLRAAAMVFILSHSRDYGFSNDKVGFCVCADHLFFIMLLQWNFIAMLVFFVTFELLPTTVVLFYYRQIPPRMPLLRYSPALWGAGGASVLAQSLLDASATRTATRDRQSDATRDMVRDTDFDREESVDLLHPQGPPSLAGSLNGSEADLTDRDPS
jgi:hypothetical protein